MIQDINNTTNGARTTNIQDFRVQLGQATSWVKEETLQYKLFYTGGSDKMNLLYPFDFNNNAAPWEVNGYKDQTQDIIKFVFEAINNDDPSMSTAIFFRAFLMGGITDNNSAQLNSFKYMGRGENFYTYQGFDRSIGFSFRMAAFTKTELDVLSNKLELLMSQVYPDYTDKQGIMRAPVVRLTIGDYLFRVAGFIENVNVTIDNNTSWETNLDGDSLQFPHVVDIAITFKPIMDTLPKRGGRLIGVRQIPSVNAAPVGLGVIDDTQNTNNPVIEEEISYIPDPINKTAFGFGSLANSAPANGGPTKQQTKSAVAKKAIKKPANKNTAPAPYKSPYGPTYGGAPATINTPGSVFNTAKPATATPLQQAIDAYKQKPVINPVTGQPFTIPFGQLGYGG
jgi:hypothetical protein